MCRSTLDIPLIHAYALPVGICLVAAAALVAVWLTPRSIGTPAKRIALGAALTLVTAVTFGLVYQARSAHIATEGHNLVASAVFVTLQVPLSAVAWQDPVDASDIELPHRELGTSTGGVEIGRFRMQNGRKVFALRTGQNSLLVPVRGSTDIILDRQLYGRFKACLAERKLIP